MRRARFADKPGTGADESTARRPIRGRQLLDGFAWFCSKQNRDHIKVISAALKKDAVQMRKEECSEVFIQWVLLWHTTGTMLPIMWHTIRGLVAAILTTAKLLGKIIVVWNLVVG